MKLVINRKKIQEERIQRGMTIRQLARAARVNEGTLYSVLEGDKAPRIDSLARIAKALDFKPLDIVTVEEGYRSESKHSAVKKKAIDD